MKLRVVKVGGSLLDWDELLPRLTNWLNGNLASPTLLVVGGGNVVDEVRQMHARWDLSENTSHWLAIHGMSLNTVALAAAMGFDGPLRTWTDVKGWLANGPSNRVVKPLHAAFVDLELMLRDHLQSPPCNWSVTSDSLSAWFAREIGADELVLLKSTRRLANSVGANVVDVAFSTFVDGIPRVSQLNLRDEIPKQFDLKTSWRKS